MDAFLEMIKNVLVFVALAVPGFLLVKTKVLSHEQSGALSKILMYVGMPFMIVNSTIHKVDFSKSELWATMGIAAAIGVLFTLAMFFASQPATAMEREEKTRGMMRFCSVFSNNGFIGLPLAAAVFPNNPNLYLAVVIINIITNVLMYTLGVYLVSGDKKLMSWKKALFNPVLIGFIVGIVLNLLGIQNNTDLKPVVNFVGYLNGLVIPISMMILGMKMGGVKFLQLFKSWKTYYVSALKLVVFPMVIVGILFACRAIWGDGLFGFDMIVGVFIAIGTPTAGLASAFSDHYNGDTENAVAFTLGTTILCVATIPLLYWLIDALLLL
ncbi:MAG: AEC family transporter [Clostridia bacterium]|nr:AEC family transporter [Clostridia bacterium]